MIRARRWLVAGLVALVGAASAGPAFADGPTAAQIAQAREDFRRGLALEAAGDWERALSVFRSVALVKSTPQVRFHIAEAERKTGDLVNALGSYKVAQYEAREAKVKDVESASTAAIASLEPTLPKLTIKRGAGADVAKMVLDGRELGPNSIGQPIAINPGPHQLQASAAGKETNDITVQLALSETKEVTVTLQVAKVAAAPKNETPTPGAPPPPTSSPMKPIGFVVGGVGLATLGVSGVFFLMKEDAISKLNKAGCDPTHCPANLKSTADSGQLDDTVSTATFIGGLALVAVGVTLVIAAPSSKPKTTGFVGAAPGADLGGLSYLGRF